jgi:ER-bound oxygenase mpaB/B'/Rubber oxygenase, catalytic domain
MGTLRWTDELFDELAQQGDPRVDDVVAAHVQATNVAPRDLFTNLTAHLRLPPANRSPVIEAYLSEEPPLPAWADEAQMHRGADFFDQNGLLIGTALFCASLPEAYAGARGARVLTLTARMVTDPVRRVYETAQMLVDAMTDGGLEPGEGAGYHDIRRVRLMHAAIRYLVLNDPKVAKTEVPAAFPSWCLPCGLPVNQEDLFGTLMTFTQTVFESLDRLGAPASDDDAESYLHRWCVVGHLLGLRADLLPLSLEDARAITAAIRRRQNAPSEDAQILTSALVRALRASVRLPVLRPLPAAMIRWLVGPEVSAIDGIKRDPFAFAFESAAGAMRGVGLEEQHHLMLRVLARHLGAAVLASFVRAGRSGTRPPFTLPRALDQRVRSTRTAWSL